ncbi:MAG: nuclear transport factor 2 family protein, partial [Balneolaceae bacterium]|nr:nuclear transport factor 2 family protein [Balneolaceae bacterium]
MKTTKEQLLNTTYSKLLDVALRNHPIEDFETLIDERFMAYGTAPDEKFYGRDGFQFLVERHRIKRNGTEIKVSQNPVVLETYADGNVALIVEELEMLVQIDGNKNSTEFRLSSIFEWQDHRWLLRHFHRSTAHDEWERKNRALNRLVAEKTAELQIKNRDLEIEAALEHVRARTMAMQKSDELAEVASVLFEQLRELGGNLWGTGFGLCEENSDSDEFWFANENGVFPPVSIPNDSDPAHKKMYEGWKKGLEFLAIEGSGDELKSHYDYMRSLAAVKPFFQKILDDGLSFPEWQQWNAAYFKHGYLLIITLEPYPEPDILKRFARVFEQTYTRFLDLQRAETQAREAKIEAALEKVRSRSMGMQSSDELHQVINIVSEQLAALEIDFDNASFIEINEDGSWEIWIAVAGQDYAPKIHVPYFDCAIMQALVEAKKNEVDFSQNVFSFEEKNVFFTHFYANTAAGKIAEERKQYVFDGEVNNVSSFTSKSPALTISKYTGDPFTDEENEIFRRFANVFEQAYTRFLDLLRAEEQAREAEVELSLERIRAQVTAMQESSDLFDIVVNMRREFISLGHEADYFWHMRWLPDSYEMSMTSEAGDRIGMVITIPKYVHDNIPVLAEWEKGDEPILVLALDVDDAWDYIENMNTHGQYQQADPDAPTRDDIDQIGGLTFIIARTSHGEIGFSLPGVVPDPPKEALDTLIRFAGVFDLAFKRFEDLKAKERQHREAQIELALERVRARTMAMQHSDELTEASQVLDEQVHALGIQTWGSAFHIYAEDAEGDYEWFSSREGTLPFYKTPRENFFLKFYEKGKAGETFHVEEFIGEDCKDHYDYLMTLPVIGDALREIVASGGSLPESQYDHIAFFKHGFVLFITYEPVPEAHDIFKRFAKVFEQTYTRFLDLQKAERQAREAKIEAALEKVRSRTMGMQSSDELPEVANLLFLEIQALGIPAWSCGYNILNDDKETAAAWMSSEGTLQEPFTLRLFGEASFDEMGEFIRSDESMLVQELGGKDLEEHYEHMKSFPDLRPTFENIESQGHSLPTYQINHLCKFRHGFLLFITYKPVPDAHDIFKRFTKVFDQTYTRFLDLKKAEAQAREAKIEAALEKVRSRSMAMHKTEELADAIGLLQRELAQLEFALDNCIFWIIDKESNKATLWVAPVNNTNLPEPYHVPFTNLPYFREVFQAWELRNPKWTYVLQGEDKKRVDEYLFNQTGFRNFPTDVKKIFQQVNKTYISISFYNYGGLHVSTEAPISESQREILSRFSKVFDQTYTRFLDLKKAEEQAREAQIENALEKVRSRSLAMQNPDELIEVAQLLRDEMGALGVEELETSSIYICDDESESTQCWFTIKDTEYPDKSVSDQMTIDLQETWVGRQMDEFYHSSEDHTSIPMKGIQRTEWIRYCEEKSDRFGNSEFYGDTIPERTYHLYKFSNGFLGAASPGEISEESRDLMKRATGVFSFAYTRFRDLQKAEESARRARQQASLDRVRADISSMRSADDLNRITPLIWNELTTLGIPFIRCGVFIIHEDEEQVEVYLSKPDGTSLAVMHLPFDANELAAETIKAWQNKEVYKQHWSKQEFMEWGRSMMEQGQVPDLRSYQGAEEAPESLYLHFIPFDQGMLYVGSTEPLDEDEINLSGSLAKAFSIAYARYEDFIKLEKAKADIEEALSELKATQSQLIQQEKLASLGQLTAGIAHEIKNPLNFVNNFSDLSVELIAEAREEIKRWTTDDWRPEDGNSLI